MSFTTVQMKPSAIPNSDRYLSTFRGAINDTNSFTYASDGTFWATYVTSTSVNNGYGISSSQTGYAGNFDRDGEFLDSQIIATETHTFRIFSEWLYLGNFPIIALANGDIAYQSTFGHYGRYLNPEIGRRGVENWNSSIAEYRSSDYSALAITSDSVPSTTVELTNGNILSQVFPGIIYGDLGPNGEFDGYAPETTIVVVNKNGTIGFTVDYNLGSSEIWIDPVLWTRTAWFEIESVPHAALTAARNDGGFSLVFLTGVGDRPTGWQIQDYAADGSRLGQLDVAIPEGAGIPVAVQTLADGRLVIVTATEEGNLAAQIYGTDGSISAPVALPFSGSDLPNTMKIDGFLEGPETAGFTWLGPQGTAYLALFDSDAEQWSMLTKVETDINARSDIAAESAEDGSFALRWISFSQEDGHTANAHVFDEFAPTFTIEDTVGATTGYFDWGHVLPDLNEGSTVSFLEDAEFGQGIFHTTLTVNNLTLNGNEGSELGVFLAPGVEELSMTGTDSLKASGAIGQTMLLGNDGNNRLSGDSITLNSDAAQVYRLYLAALGRDPDAVSFSDMIYRLVANQSLGLDLSEFASMFVNSREFSNRYGDLDSAEYVTLLYNNVLNREPDTAGLDGWVTHLNTGMSREAVLVGFSQSVEFQRSSAFSASEFAVGLATDAAGAVFRIYQAALDRLPEVSGFTNWSTVIAQGATLTEIVAGFVGSREFQNTYGSLNDTDFVELLYQNVLGRASDANGLTTWTGQLAGGATRESVVLGFSESQEFVNNTNAPLEAWMRGLGENDVLNGGSGDNILSGGLLSDRFVFNPSDGGTHQVSDLEAWDTLDFTAFSYANDDAARAFMTQVGDNVVFADQGVTVNLANTQLSEIDDIMILT
ncbi:MAG: DUF4214 domain-containing protein [Thalassovita sp.]